MKRHDQVSYILIGLAFCAFLVANIAQPIDWEASWGTILLFTFFLALAGDLGITPRTPHHAMLHVVALTALLIVGLASALWAAAVAMLLAELLRRFLARRMIFSFNYSALGWPFVALKPSSVILSLSLAGLVYHGVSDGFPSAGLGARDLLAIVPLCGSYFLASQTLSTWLLHAQGDSVSTYFRDNLWSTLAQELLPLPLAALLAAVYLQLGGLVFVVFCGSLIIFWKLARYLMVMRRDLEKRVQELNTLNKVGQAIATSLELDILLSTIYHQVSRLIEADYFYIALYNEVTDELAFPLVFEKGERKRYSGRRARNGLTEYVIHQRKPILIQEQTEQVIANLGLEVIGQPALSWLGVPIATGDKVLGVITVQSFTRAHAYDDKDMALLSTLAAQAAIALENAQLYGQMRRRTAELALLNTVSTAVSSTLDLNQVLQIVVTSIMPVTVCQKSALFLMDTTSDRLELSASEGLGMPFKQSLVWQQDAYLERVREQHIIVAPDIATSGRASEEIELARQEGYRALAEMALVTQNELIGVLAVFYDHVHRFDLAERDLLTTFANQAATAIANARLYSLTDQALARRVDELSAIERIGRELVTALEPRRVLDLVLEQAMKATSATQGCIAMLNPVQQTISVATHRGYPSLVANEFFGRSHSLDEGIIGQVLQSRELKLVPDIAQESAYLALDPSVKAQLTVPIRREGSILGAISLESNQLNGFDVQDADFVSQLATQTTVALTNAQLFQERSQRVEELSLLYQASLSLASSLDYTDVLDTISRLARHITNSDTVTLYLYDQTNEQFTRASTQGYEASKTEPSSIRSQGITRRIVVGRRPVMISDTHSSSDVNPVVKERGIRSVVGVPVMSRGEVLGVLFVNNRQPNVYTENDVRLVSALANQAGATIANVRLFSQVSEARDRLEAIINSTREGILVLDNTGRIVIANAQMERFSELSRDQLRGLKLDDWASSRQTTGLFGLSADQWSVWIDQLQTTSIKSFSRTLQIPEPSGSATEQPAGRSRPRFVDLFATPVLDETHQAIGRLMVFRDISEEKELERMREDLTDMIVHDLRSPLTAVLSGLELIKELFIDEQTDPLAVQSLDVAEHSCDNMLTMVNTLLDISRLESGKMPLERAPAPFGPLVRKAVSHLSPLAAERDVTVLVDIPSDLPMVYIDNEKISRVLLNFLDNALKFVPTAQQVAIRAQHSRTELEDVVMCSVKDTGPGIPLEFQEKIFDRFAQVRNPAAKTHRRGSGLGLAFCKLAVEAHEGRVWVESEPGAGSTFFFTLPVADLDNWMGE